MQRRHINLFKVDYPILCKLLNISGLDTYDVQAAERNIDNTHGAIASGKSRALIVVTDVYISKYYPSSTTDRNIVSTYPWDEGTLSLLKTIHVEKINATSWSAYNLQESISLFAILLTGPILASGKVPIPYTMESIIDNCQLSKKRICSIFGWFTCHGNEIR